MKHLLFILGCCCIAAGIFLTWFVPRAWMWQGDDSARVTFTVSDGWTVSQTADALVRAGVIDSAFGYRTYASLHEDASHVRSGEYHFVSRMNYRAIVRALALGPAKNDVKITIPEGWTIDLISQNQRGSRI